MGFDQYHEPPEELSPEQRTFARMSASPTEKVLFTEGDIVEEAEEAADEAPES